MESKPSTYADTLNALDQMQQALPYSVRKPVLAEAERIIVDLETELTAARAELARERERLAEFRDTVLNQRGALAENGMTNDQVNDVLTEFDAALEANK